MTDPHPRTTSPDADTSGSGTPSDPVDRRSAWLDALDSEPAARATDAPGPDPTIPLAEPLRPVVRERSLGTGALLVALFVVAVLAGSALFVAGFSLGRQQGQTAGTAEGLQGAFAPFWDAYHKIDEDYIGDVPTKQLVEGAIKGMFQALGDPYSSYMTQEEYEAALSSISGRFEGIGAEMTSRDDAGETGCSPAGADCHLVIVRTLPDSPAQAAGLRAEDEVVAVDGESVAGKTLDDVVASIRGPRGTKVSLTVSRADAAPIEITVTREVIESEDVSSEVIADGDVGYIRINGFSSSAADDFTTQLRELVVEKDLEKLVLDLRDDPGGFVEAAEAIASQFVGSGPVFYEEFADGQREAHDAEPGGVATDPSIELVVLVNGGTASASEIVAGAIQDTGRGRLVGETTFGKGTIQQWQTLENAGGFRLSTAKWLTPKGRWIHQKGLTPDVEVEQPAELAEGEDPQLDRAVELLLGDETGSIELRRAA